MRCLYIEFIFGVKVINGENIGKRNTQKEAMIGNLKPIKKLKGDYGKDCYMLKKTDRYFGRNYRRHGKGLLS